MVDRAPTKPNRYAVYDENHNFIRYEYHERADEPTQEGDALNKANLLPDDVAAALGLTGNPQVKDALEKIKTLVDANTTLANGKAKIATGSYTGTGTVGSGSPNSLAFGFTAKWVLIFPNAKEQFRGEFLNPSTVGDMRQINNTGCKSATVTWSDNGVSWYALENGAYQCNNSGIMYYYVAIG